MTFELKDYVEVSDRIRAWHDQHPQGRIATTILTFNENRVVVAAEVFRGPDDVNPAGTGHSYLDLPGSTPYTKGSELENAETSAVGRALVMAGIPSKNVASQNEVRSKRGGAPAATDREPSSPASTDTPASPPTTIAGATAVCPDCGEKAYTEDRLSPGQVNAGFVRCVNTTCERVYQRETT